MRTFDLCVVRVRKRILIGGCSACTLTEQDDTVRISPKVGDVIVDPSNRRVKVQQSEILRCSLANQLRCIRLSKDVKTIVESDNRNVVIVTNEVGPHINGNVALVKKKINQYQDIDPA